MEAFKIHLNLEVTDICSLLLEITCVYLYLILFYLTEYFQEDLIC